VEGWWAVSYVVLWGLVVMLCVVVVALARQIGTLHLRLGPRGALEMDDEGPPLGEGTPIVDVVDTEGREVQVGGKGQVLMFVSPGCSMCAQVMPGLSAVADEAGLEPLIVSDTDPEETRSQFEAKGANARVVAGSSFIESFAVPGTPYIVVLDRWGVVRGKGTVNNLEQLEGLVETARRRTEELEVVTE
jgi:methylamine dehydrogenase accessory protein MauD